MKSKKKYTTTKLPACLADVESPEDAVIRILRAQLAASEARAERLESALTPRKWTKQQAHVWHCTIPDVDMAFEALRIATLAEQEGVKGD